MDKSAADARWYALHVRSRAEKYVSAQLETKRYEVFLPLYWSKRRWADRWKKVSFPLFPGYVFCRFDPAERSAVSATSGLIEVVRVGNELAQVETSDIEAIRRVAASPLGVEPYPGLVRGQRVRMRGGPLRGIEGTLLQIRNSLRLVVSVELLRRSVLAEIERDWAVPCESLPCHESRAATGECERNPGGA